MAVVDSRLVFEQGDTVVYQLTRYGVPVRLSEAGSRLARTVRTQAQARFLVPAGPRFVLRHRSLRSLRAGRSWHHEGDLRISSDYPDTTRALIGSRVAELLAELPDVIVESDGAVVTAWFSGQTDVERVDPFVDLVIAIAGADIFGLSELRALPGARYHAPDGDFDWRTAPYVEVHVPTRVDLAPVALGGVAQTWAARSYDHARPFTVDLPYGPLPRLPLSADVRRYIDAAGPGTLAAREGTLTYTWRGIQTRRERLLAGARLLAAFPPPHTDGVYR
jgi:hypothetical protein